MDIFQENMCKALEEIEKSSKALREFIKNNPSKLYNEEYYELKANLREAYFQYDKLV